MAERTVLLVDYENIGDAGLEKLPQHQRLLLFVGQGQKPKQDFVQTVMKSGVRLDMIPVTGVGKNNLDFHLSFYLGRLVEEDPGSKYVIFSKDKGFAPLSRHLAALGISCTHERPQADEKPAAPTRKPEQKHALSPAAYEKVAAFLSHNPPKTKAKLLNAIRSQAMVSEAEAEGTVAYLVKKGLAVIDAQGRVTYPKPKN